MALVLVPIASLAGLRCLSLSGRIAAGSESSSRVRAGRLLAEARRIHHGLVLHGLRRDGDRPVNKVAAVLHHESVVVGAYHCALGLLEGGPGGSLAKVREARAGSCGHRDCYAAGVAGKVAW